MITFCLFCESIDDISFIVHRINHHVDVYSILTINHPFSKTDSIFLIILLLRE